jgi:tetrahydromethanopterin S-methyltransferase subunit G
MLVLDTTLRRRIPAPIQQIEARRPGDLAVDDDEIGDLEKRLAEVERQIVAVANKLARIA